MGSRRKARELALMALYSWEINPWEGEPPPPLKAFRGRVSAGSAAYAEELVRGVLAGVPELDELIRNHSTNWKIERLARLDRAILRLALFEMIHVPGLPHPVVINEAVELAKKFSTEQSGGFINGLLDQVRIRREEKSV